VDERLVRRYKGRITLDTTSSRRRVAITGLGIVSAVGLNEEEVWGSLISGGSGIGPLTSFDASECAVQIGAEIDDAELLPRLKARRIRKRDRSVALALEAAGQALEGAGLRSPEAATEGDSDIATFVGCGVGPAESLYAGFQRFAKVGPTRMRPSSVPTFMANGLSANLSMQYRLKGTNQTVVAACTSSTNAIGHAVRAIRHGYVPTALCGGAEATFDPFYYGVWTNLGVLSSIEDPARAYRPFASDRDGCLLGEGAGMLVLEDWDRAVARGAEIRGEILGYGESSDATHMTNPEVEGQSGAISNALRDAGVEPSQVGYINAHGTATKVNDSLECQSIRTALGSATDSIPVGSCKAAFGHLLGASGAVETIATLLALEHGVLPPNLNLENPDPACDVKLIGGEAEPTDAEIAMKNSFGFGGGNAVLVLRRS